jgi:hypothetical protein
MSQSSHSLINFYKAAFQQLDGKRAAPPISVEFYPYVGMRHTIRMRDGQIFVRLSDLSKPAAATIHQSLAFILVAKLLRRRIPKTHIEVYRNYIAAPELGEQANESRRLRGRKILTSAKGEFYDLEKVFASVNAAYFQNRLAAPVLSWSRTKTRRVFGHQDSIHETIIISRTLDDERVPPFVVEFVLYHELLHVVHPAKIINGKRRMHGAAFRRDERKFARFEEAEKWLEKLARQRQTAEIRRSRAKTK